MGTGSTSHFPNSKQVHKHTSESSFANHINVQPPSLAPADPSSGSIAATKNTMITATALPAATTTTSTTAYSMFLEPDAGSVTPIPGCIAAATTPLTLTPPQLWATTLGIVRKKLTQSELTFIELDALGSACAGENIQSVIKMLNMAQGDERQGRWRYKDRNGNEVVVVERYRKILTVIDKYAMIVDIAIQHNPEFVALAWSGIRAMLNVTLNHIEAVEIFEATIATMVEKLAICEFYYSIFAGVSLPTISAASAMKLEKNVITALPGLYATIIIFLLKARQYFDARWTKKLTNIFTPFVVEVQPFIDDITAKEKALREYAQMANMMSNKESNMRVTQIENLMNTLEADIQTLVKLDDIANATLQTLTMAAMLDTQAEEERVRKLLSLLSTLEVRKRHRDVRAGRLAGTGEWLFQVEAFSTWRDRDTSSTLKDRILCCYGIPGAGKTVMSSLVIDHLESRFKGDNATGVACLYADHRDQRSQTLTQILGSILQQLLASLPISQISENVVEKLESHRDQSSGALELTEILKMMQVVLKQFKSIFLCIDALDELEPLTRSKFLNTIKLELDLTTTKVFFTGRHHMKSEIQDYFETETTNEINIAATIDDIQAYLVQQIDLDGIENSDAMNDQLKSEILTVIAEQSNGMFLLPALHIDTVLQKPTIAKRREALKTSPPGLDESFGLIIHRIQQSRRYAELGMRVLTWLHLATRPLQLTELQHALSVEMEYSEFNPDNIPSKEILQDSCFGLVTFDSETSTIRLVHYSLKEFLDKSRNIYFIDALSYAAQVCLRYLYFEEARRPCANIEELRAVAAKFPFLEYAAENWASYFRPVQSNVLAKEAALKLLGKGKEKTQPSAAIQILYRRMNHYGSLNGGYHKCCGQPRCENQIALHFSGLHVAIYLELEEIVQYYCQSTGVDINAEDDEVQYGITPLSLAAQTGNQGIVLMLLKQERIELPTQRSCTPFNQIAHHENVHVLNILWEKYLQANLNSTEGWLEDLISAAISLGCELTIKKIIKEFGSHLLLQEIRQVAWSGNVDIVHLLLEQESVNWQVIVKREYFDNHTLLSCILTRGHKNWAGALQIMRLLVKKGADVNIKAGYDHTPLIVRAAGNGYVPIVEYLLKQKADIHATNQYGKTALAAACEEGHEGVVRILLSQDHVDVNVRDDQGRTPLSLAAGQLKSEIVGLLINDDIDDPRVNLDLNSRDNDGRTALILAILQPEICPEHSTDHCSKDMIEVVRLLIERDEGAIHRQDSAGRTPLSYAVFYKHIGVAQLLMERGSSLEVTDNNGRTSLSWAAQAGQKAFQINQFLAEGRGINLMINQTDKNGRTLLSWAAYGGHKNVIQLLIEHHGADPSVGDHSGRTPLSWAAQMQQEEVVMSLVEKYGADINQADLDGRTSLWWAIRHNWNGDMIRKLIGLGYVDIDKQDPNGRTPFSWAASVGNQEIVEVFVQKEDVDLTLADKDGLTPLAWAARNGHEQVVKLLLRQDGVDVNSADHGGLTPILWAAREGHERVVEQLLQEFDVNVSFPELDSYGMTPLSRAAASGDAEMVQFLLQQDGVDVNLVTALGRTALSWAAWGGHGKVVNMLLLEGKHVDLNGYDYAGWTPLIHAAYAGHEEVVQLLVQQDANVLDVHAVDNGGQTALSWAAMNGHATIVQCLVKQDGVNINTVDTQNRTAFSWAVENKHEEVVRCLLQQNGIDDSLPAADETNRTTPSWAAMCWPGARMQAFLLRQFEQHHRG